MKFTEPVTAKAFFEEGKQMLAAMADAGLENPRFIYAEKDGGDAIVGFAGDAAGRPSECTVWAPADKEAHVVLALLRMASTEFISRSI